MHAQVDESQSSILSCTTNSDTQNMKNSVCLMSYCQKLSLSFLAILTHQFFLCVFMALQLIISMMSKAMRLEW